MKVIFSDLLDMLCYVYCLFFNIGVSFIYVYCVFYGILFIVLYVFEFYLYIIFVNDDNLDMVMVVFEGLLLFYCMQWIILYYFNKVLGDWQDVFCDILLISMKEIVFGLQYDLLKLYFNFVY